MRTDRFKPAPMICKLLYIGMLAILCSSRASAQEIYSLGDSAPRQGLWVSSIEEMTVLGEAKKIDDLLTYCSANGFDTLFIQIYRGDRAWYASEIADRTPYDANFASVGEDSFRYLIRQAHIHGIEVHAWINSLSLAQNNNAPILKRYGQEILTKDQHDRLPLRKEKDHLDRYYDVENQLFMEPGDPRVRSHLAAISTEIAVGYPELDGIHFDYIRYPSSVPFVPGSRFNYVGLSYGYGEYNIRRFQEALGIDPKHMSGKIREAGLWDQWKRDQVTETLLNASRAARDHNPKLQISCAVVPSFDRFYESASQDWPRWIEEGVVDFVVVMNYTLDPRRFDLLGKASLAMSKDPHKIYLGIGGYLLKDEPKDLKQQWEIARSLPSGGVVFFSYTSVSQSSFMDL